MPNPYLHSMPRLRQGSGRGSISTEPRALLGLILLQLPQYVPMLGCVPLEAHSSPSCLNTVKAARSTHSPPVREGPQLLQAFAVLCQR